MTAPAEFPLLQTERLLLREIVEADAPQLLRIHGDAGHMQWFGSDPLTDLEAAKKLVQTFAGWRQMPSPGTRWAISLREEPALIGTCGLFAWHPLWHKCTLGYELAPEHTGRGLMREALTAIFDWGFGAMALHRIEAQVHPANAPSLRLLRGLGFRQEGLLREVGRWGGRHHDLIQHGLLANEWTAAKTQGPGDDPEAMLRAVETRRIRALVERDLPTLEALHAPGYQLVTPSGQVFTRERYLAAIAAQPFYAAWDAGEMQVRLAPGMGIVRYQARLRFPSGRELPCWHTDSYELREGSWQAVWSQATEIAPAARGG